MEDVRKDCSVVFNILKLKPLDEISGNQIKKKQQQKKQRTLLCDCKL